MAVARQHQSEEGATVRPTKGGAMRTRIALVAIIPIALITVALLSPAAAAQPFRARLSSPLHSAKPTAGHRPGHVSGRLTAYVTVGSPATSALPDFGVAKALLTGYAAGHQATVPAPAPMPAPIVVDTVSSAQRAAWDRVAGCEEGGNWQADGPRFSGGLGITRTNWAEYGGLKYASSAAQATPDQQIMVAERIQSYPPDQRGCSSW
jgi:Transglycosylase-like domain